MLVGSQMEKRLARRISRQRARLRWLEDRQTDVGTKWRRYFEMALRLGRENRELRAQVSDLQETLDDIESRNQDLPI